MLIYRVENSNGIGPYTNEDNLMQKHTYSGNPKQPEPGEDFTLRLAMTAKFKDLELPEKYKFGFCSLEQARKWIYKKSWCNSLRNNGYRLVAFEVPDKYVLSGRSQVVYDSNQVKKSTRKSSCVVKSIWRDYGKE